ncbi:MAG: hypothetical protein GC202_14275 [Alphaproteobacteria bacterium]|nr:hypothetical protein [Alphaproteobacteria bacterium]
MANGFTIAMKATLDPSGVKTGSAEATREINEMVAAARTAETVAQNEVAKAASAAAQGTSNVVRLNRAQLTNMQYQLHDIATGLVSGQSPFVVMMQQGLQLTQMFGEGTGLLGVLKAVGGGLVAFLANPLTLAVVGFGIAASAAQALWGALTGGGANAAEEALKRHKDWVDAIAAAYPEAAAAAKAYESEVNKLPRSLAIAQGQDLLSQYKAQWTDIVQQVDKFAFRLDRVANQDSLGAVEHQIRAAIAEFDKTQNVAAFQDALGRIKNTFPDMSGSARQFLSDLIALSGEASKLEGYIKGTAAGVDALKVERMKMFGGAVGPGDALKQINQIAEGARTARQRLDDLFTLNVGQARTTGEIDALTAAYNRAVKALDAKEATQGAKKTASAFETTTAAIDKQTAALRAEAAIYGQSSAEVARAKIQQQLLTAAKQAGLTVDAKLTDEINRQADAYAAATQAAAEAKALADLRDEQRQLGMSADQQRIYNMLKATGADANSAFGQSVTELVTQIGSERGTIDSLRQGYEGLFSSFGRYLQQGKDLWSAFKAAAADTLASVGQDFLKLAASQSFNAILGLFGFGGGGLGGNFVGTGFGSVGLYDGGGYTGNAPRNRITGLVHGQEFVLNADATAKYRPLLEAMNDNRDLGGVRALGSVSTLPAVAPRAGAAQSLATGGITVNLNTVNNFGGATDGRQLRSLLEEHDRKLLAKVPAAMQDAIRRAAS